MESEFWVSLAKNDYKIPAGHTLDELTKTLFGYLGNTDPELRDDIAYIVYANFLKREMYSKDDIRGHADELSSNLKNGLGETETDSVFLRTFSMLLLAEIFYNDNKKPLLEKKQVELILAKGLSYLAAENDPRGYIPVKGWAHALAHTADLLKELGRSRFVEQSQLKIILEGILIKLVQSSHWVYLHGEDERLANVNVAILQRGMLTTEYLDKWLKSFTEPETSWKGEYVNEEHAKAFHNVRNFLRSLSEVIRKSDELPQKEDIQNTVYDALDNLKPY
jgi:hypothetical protein